MQRLQRQWALSDSALCSILISNLGRFIIVRYGQSPSIIVINVTNRRQCSIYFFVPHLFIGHNIWSFGIFSGRNFTRALFLGHKVYLYRVSLLCISIHVVIIVLVDRRVVPCLLYEPTICISLLGEYWLKCRLYTWICCLQYYDASAAPGIDFPKWHDHCNSTSHVTLFFSFMPFLFYTLQACHSTDPIWDLPIYYLQTAALF